MIRINRHFTKETSNAVDDFEWNTKSVEISGADGEAVFEMDNIWAPACWSDQAVSIVASKYFRKRGTERHIFQTVSRMTKSWKEFGQDNGYFKDQQDAHIFCEELNHMILNQMCAPNSPQWFNTGISQYVCGSAQPGHYYINSDDELCESKDAYTYPQVHACFIQPVADRLVGPGGIMDLLEREALLFKYGSGTGTNFSTIRSAGEPLENGGTSAGLMQWLLVGDRAAGAIKSGGTTRRAAKMVILDADHPDIFDFVRWKAREEAKLQAMVNGYDNLIAEIGGLFAQTVGHLRLNLNFDFNGEAYHSISGQNSNNSVRVTDEFMRRVRKAGTWTTHWRVDPEQKFECDAKELWNEITTAAWMCGDPGLQFHDTINRWHTCKMSGEIRASNPCSEYMFIDNTACNLASINLGKFIKDDGTFDIGNFIHVVRLWTIVLDISVGMAQYPSKEMAVNSHRYRTLGLGWTNLGCVLMRMGLPYDSDKARSFAAAVTSLMTATAYETSAEMASELGEFSGFSENVMSMRDVIETHAGHSDGIPVQNSEMISQIKAAASETWKRNREAKGFRNAQVTCIAPTGTISFVMDCETTGIEPFFALVADKKLSGGGDLSIVCKSFEPAISKLGYDTTTKTKILTQLRNGTSASLIPELGSNVKIFETATGSPALSPISHIAMMGAVQPFISGAISKSVNMPNDATVEDISEIYMEAWLHGLKSVAVYRDGSKQSQPMNVRRKPSESVDTRKEPFENLESLGIRRTLPDDRTGRTHKFKIDGVSGFITVGEFEDGTPGEVFIRMAKAGTTVHGFCETVGRSWSMMLQCGVPIEELIAGFKGVRFEPNGMTHNENIRFTSSVIDYVVRWLECWYFPDASGEPSGESSDEKDTERRLHTPEKILYTQDIPDRIDRPMCADCGSLMIPAGTCYTCPNCGSTGGCG